jgi:hypothetical protein
MVKLWSTTDDACLRQFYGRMRTLDLAVCLERSENAVGQRALKLGLDSGRYWSEEELVCLRQHYGREPVPVTAARLDRPIGQVYQTAVRYGIATHPQWPAEVLEAIRRGHADGLTDVAIGRRIGLSRNQVHAVRYARFGLPPNEPAILEARRRGIRTQRQVLGIRTSGELRALMHRRYAVENGWPAELLPREVQILNVLARAGVPLSRLEIARAIGMRTDREDRPGHLALLTGNGPGGTYTASLMRRGLVACLKRAITGRGRGRSIDAYYLGPAALNILRTRACQQQSKKTATGA